MAEGTILNSNSDTTDSEGIFSRVPFTVSKKVRYLIFALIAIIIVTVVSLGVRSWQNAPPAEVYIDPAGLSLTQYQALKQALGDQAPGSYFSADLQAMRDLVLGLSWVDEVSLMRDWQRGIVVTALPKQAVARFGTERLVDAKGDVFVPTNPADLADKQLVTLQGNQPQAPVIMQQMQQINEWYEPLEMTVEDIILTPRMTWIVRFDDGLRVIVDNENTAQKLLNLSQLLRHQLKDRRDEIEAIDLRYKNGFTISWKSGLIS